MITLSLTIENPNGQSALERCPDEEDLKQAVTSRLGRSPFAQDAPRHVETLVWATGDKIIGRIQLKDNKGLVIGERTVRAREACREVAESLALAIAIAIDPLNTNAEDDAGTGLLNPKESETKEKTDARSSSPPPISEASPTPSSPEPLKTVFHLGSTGTIGIAPDIAWGIDSGAGLRWRRFSLILSCRFDLPTSAPLEPGRVTVRHTAAQLGLCYHYASLMACLSTTVGALKGTGSGLSDAKTVYLPSAAAGIRLGVEPPINKVFFVRIYAELLGAFTRNRLLEDDTDAVLFETDPFSVSWGIAVGGSFF